MNSQSQQVNTQILSEVAQAACLPLWCQNINASHCSPWMNEQNIPRDVDTPRNRQFLYSIEKNHVDSSGFHAVSRSFENTRDTLFAWESHWYRSRGVSEIQEVSQSVLHSRWRNDGPARVYRDIALRSYDSRFPMETAAPQNGSRKMAHVFTTRLESDRYWNRLVRVPGIPELSQETILRLQGWRNDNSFSLCLSLNGQLRFRRCIGEKVGEKFDPRCVKFLYADRIRFSFPRRFDTFIFREDNTLELPSARSFNLANGWNVECLLKERCC